MSRMLTALDASRQHFACLLRCLQTHRCSIYQYRKMPAILCSRDCRGLGMAQEVQSDNQVITLTLFCIYCKSAGLDLIDLQQSRSVPHLALFSV